MTEHRDLAAIHWHGAAFGGATGSPVGAVTPDQVGQTYRDTTTDTVWMSTGLNNTDWIQIFPAPAPGGTITRPYTGGVALRDLVYQKNDGTVDKASATAVATSILVGFVEQLDTPLVGQCTVRYLGDLSGFVGLVPGAIYVLGKTAGTIVRETLTGDANYPDQTPQSGHTSYKVGTAGTSSKLWVDISRGFTEF